MEFTLETFSLLHYLLKSFGVGVLAIVVGHGNTRKRKQQLPNQDTSWKDRVVPLQGVACFGHGRQSLLFHMDETRCSKEAQVNT